LAARSASRATRAASSRAARSIRFRLLARALGLLGLLLRAPFGLLG
jgi:hypothetical protein